MSYKIPEKMKKLLNDCGKVLDNYTYSIDTESNGSSFYEIGTVTDNGVYYFMDWLEKTGDKDLFNRLLKNADGLKSQENPYYYFTYIDWDKISFGENEDDETDMQNCLSLWLIFLLDKNWENIKVGPTEK